MGEEIELSIVIPTYNEKTRIARTLDAYLAFYERTGLGYEIIVADYSSDGSKELIRDYEARVGKVRLLDITERGKGLAVYHGFAAARGELIGFTDADNATPPEEFYKIVEAARGDDSAIGSRGLGRSNVVHYNQSLFRRFGSLVLDLLFVRLMFGLRISDTQCGAKVFRRGKLMPILPAMRIKNSIFDVELLWRFSKVGGIREVPIRWTDDKFSHFKWTETLDEAYWLLRVRLGV